MSIHHPNIVRILAHVKGPGPDEYCIYMERYDLGDLNQCIHTIQYTQKRHICSGALEGMHKLHDIISLHDPARLHVEAMSSSLVGQNWLQRLKQKYLDRSVVQVLIRCITASQEVHMGGQEAAYQHRAVVAAML